MKQWIRFILSKQFLKTVIFGGLFVVLIGATTLFWMHRTTQHGKFVQVPDIRLMTLDKAIRVIDSVGLTFEVIDSMNYVPGVEKGAVVELFPEAFAKVKLGRKLLLSTNPNELPKFPLPNYKDEFVGYVTSKFNQKGMIIDELIMVPDVSHDLVLKVVDQEGNIAEEQELYTTGSHFTLYVSSGRGNVKAYIPDLVGKTMEEAKQLLMTYNLNVGAMTYGEQVSDSTKVIIEQQYPRYGADVRVPVGSSIDLWLTIDTLAQMPSANQLPDSTNLP